MASKNVLLLNSDNICALDLDGECITGRQSMDILACDVHSILRAVAILAQ